MEAKKILLVEDDPNFGSVLRDYLVINDFEVTLAKNGMEGFEKFPSFDLQAPPPQADYAHQGYVVFRASMFHKMQAISQKIKTKMQALQSA